MTHLTASDVLALLGEAERGSYELDVAVTALVTGREGGEYGSYSRSLDAAMSLVPAGHLFRLELQEDDAFAAECWRAGSPPSLATAGTAPLALSMAAILAREAIRESQR